MELRGQARRWLLLAVVLLHTLTHGAGAQSPPPPPTVAAAQTNESDGLAAYTAGLLVQNLTVLGQVVYLGNPDWATLELEAQLVNATASASAAVCPTGGPQLQAFTAYVDGYRVPPEAAGGVTLSDSGAPWAAVVSSRSSENSAAAGSPPPPPGGGGGVAGRLRRTLFSFSLNNITNPTLRNAWLSFQSAYDNARSQALATQELLTRGRAAVPGPDGPLAKPVLAANRKGASVATVSGYSRGAMADLDSAISMALAGDSSSSSSSSSGTSGSSTGASSSAAGAAPPYRILSDRARVYRAPEDDCMRLVARKGRPLSTVDASSVASSSSGSSSSSILGQAAANGSATFTQDSCFVTQIAVYIYNPCAPLDPALINSTSTDAAANTTSGSSSSSSNSGSSGGSSSSGGSNNSAMGLSSGAQRLFGLVDASLAQTAPEVNATDAGGGYVVVVVRYWPYNSCVRRGADTLSDVSLQVMVFAALAFGWLLLFLLLPSLYRLFLEFPFRLLVHGIQKLLGKSDKLKPLKPGLHSQKAHRGFALPRPLAAVVGPVLALRKRLLYAVATVHYSDGQSRWLQVCVISNVALSIGIAVYSPRLAPPLEHFVPPLALAISRNADAVAALQYFVDIVAFSSFMGTLGYLSMLANYNSPVNEYYRPQCIISAFFMLLADVLMLLQLVSLLSQWAYLQPSPYPYLPLVVFQCINLAAANVLQGIIFSKRHDQHNNSIYAAYQEARRNRKQAAADARAEKRAAFKAERLQAKTKAAGGRNRGGGGLGQGAGGEGEEDWDGSSGSGSAADDRDVWMTVGAPEAEAGGAGAPRPSVDTNAGVVNFRRHRERESRPSPGPHDAHDIAAAASAGSAGAGARVHRPPPSPDAEEDEEEPAEAPAVRSGSRRRDAAAAAAAAPAELPASPVSGRQSAGRHSRQPAKVTRPGSRRRGAAADGTARRGAAAGDSSAEGGRGHGHDDEAECQGGDADWGTSPLRRHTSGGPSSGRNRGGGAGAGDSEDDDNDPAALHSRPRRRLLGGDGPGPLGEGREWRRSHEALSEDDGDDAHLLSAAAAVKRGTDGSSGSGVALLPKAGGGRASRRANDHHSTAHSHAAQQPAGAAVGVERKRSGRIGGTAPDVAAKAHAHTHAHAPARGPANGGVEEAALQHSRSGGVWDHVPRQGSGRRLLGGSSFDEGSSHHRSLFGAVAQEAAAATAAASPLAAKKNAEVERGNEQQEPASHYKRPIKHASTYSGGALGPEGKNKGGAHAAGASARDTRSRSAPGRKATSGLSGGGKEKGQWGWMGANVSDSGSDGSGSEGSSRRSQAGGIMGVLTWPLRASRKVWCAVREANGFRYPAWLLAALLVSGYMVVFQYGRALQWSDTLGTCFEDPGACLSGTLGRYVRFATAAFGHAAQQRLQDSLTALLATRPALTDMLTGALGGNSSGNSSLSLFGGGNSSSSAEGGVSSLLANLTGLIPGLSTDATDALTSSLNFSQVVSAAINQTLNDGGGGGNGTAGVGTGTNVTSNSSIGGANNSALAALLTPSLSAALEAQLALALESRLRGLADRLNASVAAAAASNATSAQTEALRAAALAALNTTLTTLYDTVNTTARFVGRTMEVSQEIVVWRAGLVNRFRWSSVLGFTLGLALGLSTLIQTAASFQRAVRNATTLRVMRRLFGRVGVGAEGAAAGGTAGMGMGGVGGGRHGGGVASLVSVEDSLLANRAMKTSVSLVVFFFGVLMSTAVIQLYMVGVLLSSLLALLFHPWTWDYLVPNYWLYAVAVAAVFVLNKYVLIGYVGDAFLSNGDHIYRPAAWLAFTFIMSITNLVIGLLLAVYRIVLLLLTTVVALGKLEVTIFTFATDLDLPHNSFLAGLHMHESMSRFHDPIYLPGPRGRAHRRWRKLRDTVRKLGPEQLRLLATLGRPKEVQDVLDHVVIDMQAARHLATASNRPTADGTAPAGMARPSTDVQGWAGGSLATGSRPLASGSRPLTSAANGAGAGAAAGAAGKPPLGAGSRPLATSSKPVAPSRFSRPAGSAGAGVTPFGGAAAHAAVAAGSSRDGTEPQGGSYTRGSAGLGAHSSRDGSLRHGGDSGAERTSGPGAAVAMPSNAAFHTHASSQVPPEGRVSGAGGARARRAAGQQHLEADGGDSSGDAAPHRAVVAAGGRRERAHAPERTVHRDVQLADELEAEEPLTREAGRRAHRVHDTRRQGPRRSRHREEEQPLTAPDVEEEEEDGGEGPAAAAAEARSPRHRRGLGRSAGPSAAAARSPASGPGRGRRLLYDDGDDDV
ncbi:hypothetical protein HXX76_003998 [Chlamydomonas incerta]|uniref:Uncharacterized protein n=1 Tax=Chlamydomonas incerta TaxID=51695 RepID=A0A835W9B5_CHLIN|nr:hypothetical protein HXX76_003998 [Chlamydomonas incerta]|eukprot:KAG2441146.1 hypothetical protein HXX76_003998 [Chlamydomonas incerta]